MTIAIGIAVPEGIIIAGDSRTTYGNPRNHPKIASDYTQKLYQLTEKVGAMTFGWANLSGKNIHSHVERFRQDHKPDADIDEIIAPFQDYFEKLYNEHVKAGHDNPAAYAFGFIVGGYDAKGEGKLYECWFPGKQKIDRATTSSPGAVWRGQTDIVCRLIKGYDQRIPKSTFPPDVVKALDESEYIIYFNRMNLQDAIDFAIFLARATIEMQRFSDGILADPGATSGVGGHIDVALIRPSGFGWIQKKELRGEVPSWMKSIT